jgi:hypothetical protein
LEGPAVIQFFVRGEGEREERRRDLKDTIASNYSYKRTNNPAAN